MGMHASLWAGLCSSLMLLCCAVLCRYYVLRHSLHPLKDVGLLCFRGERKGCDRSIAFCCPKALGAASFLAAPVEHSHWYCRRH